MKPQENQPVIFLEPLTNKVLAGIYKDGHFQSISPDYRVEIDFYPEMEVTQWQTAESAWNNSVLSVIRNGGAVLNQVHPPT